MESKKIVIAPLTPRELDKHHFDDYEWEVNVHHLFHINRVEEVLSKIKFPLLPHRKTVYDFVFLLEGDSIRSKGLHEYQFSRNTFFFLPAYQISTHQYISKGAKGFYCHFDAEIFNKLFPHNSFFEDFSFLHFSGEPLVEINDDMLPAIMNILIRLEQAYKTNNETFNINLIVSYLLVLFTELKLVQKTTANIPKNAALRVTEKFKNLLSQHIYQTNKVVEYASMLSISPDHLNKCVKMTIGKTAQELLADMIILEAKVLLKQTNLAISEIAFKFSETNPSDFSRFFKNRTNTTPKQFRQLSDFK
ncbi:MAG: helix-turn-helix domain-containing protein [Arcicella sp.]|jgi:AraC-like DNA-binding protein|nr:helix-turn-helix domain-containing protein [Arcicella sp.]